MKTVATEISASAETTNPGLLLPLRRWLIGGGICWLILAPVAITFARSRHLDRATSIPLALAFLTEVTFYILPGFTGARSFLRHAMTPGRAATLLSAAALLPYLILTVPQFCFSPVRFLTLALIMATVAFWFTFPPHRARDLAFLILLAAVLLSGVFAWIYPSPDSKTPVYVLGHLTLISTALLSVLVVDRRAPIRFGFIPTPRECGIGAAWAIAAAAVALPFGLWLGVLHLGAHRVPILIAVGEVLGFFWVVALSEEFFFRAMLQGWLAEWTGSMKISLITASVVFGLCHLYFARQFPNIRFALLVAVVGSFYGAAYIQAKSMRASMVTHALLISAWRLFLHS